MSTAANTLRSTHTAHPWLVAGSLAAVAGAFATAFWLGESVPAWMRVFVIAGGCIAGLKGLTWANFAETDEARNVPAWRMWAYLLAWPGMNPRAFCDANDRPEIPSAERWLAAVGFVLLGGTLLFVVAPRVAPDALLWKGAVGMTGFLFLMHFGLIELVALAWQAAGVRAESIMHAPIAATSLADFWGRRWNMAFRDAAHELVAKPVAATLGTTAACIAVFVASGLVHEAAISIPAGGGYGWPTLYFALQCVALLFERSRYGKALGLGRGVTGWLFTAAIVVGPILWLFHGPFLRLVIAPMVSLVG